MRSIFKRIATAVWKEVSMPTIEGSSKTMRLIVGALLSSITVVLQSAGVFTGIGFLLSMMSTGPIVLACLLSIRIGIMVYVVATFLLVILQPSELLIFLFTTGLLGLGLGIGLKYLKRSLFIILFAAFCLTFGISILLYGFKFPILGPSVTSPFSSSVIFWIFIFSVLYSWIWKKISLSLFNILKIALFQWMSHRK